MDEGLKWFSTLGVGGVLAGMMFFYTRAQSKAESESRATESKANAEARERQAVDYAKSLITFNERLEHLVNTARMERQASQQALLDTLKDVTGVIATHTSTIHELRDWLRSDRR